MLESRHPPSARRRRRRKESPILSPQAYNVPSDDRAVDPTEVRVASRHHQQGTSHKQGDVNHQQPRESPTSPLQGGRIRKHQQDSRVWGTGKDASSHDVLMLAGKMLSEETQMKDMLRRLQMLEEVEHAKKILGEGVKVRKGHSLSCPVLVLLHS